MLRVRQNSYLRRAEAEEDSFCVCENSVLIGLQRARGEVGLRKKRNFILAAVGTVVVLAVCFGYGHFVSNKIYEESTSHLREVYSQVNKTFTSLVSRNWSLLSDWSYYINHTIEAGEEDEIQEYLDSGRGEWGFTQFYFLNCDGSYLTIQGERGTLDFGEQMNDLVIQKKNVVMDSMQPGGGALTVFAIPVKQKSYKGFDYCEIAISYNNEDMEQVLDVSAFSDKSDCYVVYPDGKILFAAETKEEQPYNYLTFMEENSDLKDDQLDQIRRDMESGVEGMIQFRMTGREQYLSYQPVGFQDWVLLGIVPQQVVNASMNQVQLVTVILLTAVFLLIAEVGLVAVVRRGRKNLRDKELELKYREQLFGVVVDNMPDIFAMFSPRGLQRRIPQPKCGTVIGYSCGRNPKRPERSRIFGGKQGGGTDLGRDETNPRRRKSPLRTRADSSEDRSASVVSGDSVSYGYRRPGKIHSHHGGPHKGTSGPGASGYGAGYRQERKRGEEQLSVQYVSRYTDADECDRGICDAFGARYEPAGESAGIRPQDHDFQSAFA